MAGRPRKPTAQRILEGNPGRRPIPDEPELPKIELGSTPAYLTKEAAEFYRDFVPRLRLLGSASVLDEPMIVVMSASWGIAMRALGRLKREGTVRKGQRNPADRVWLDNAAMFGQIAAKFGMTQADRARLFAGGKPKASDAPTDTLDGNWYPLSPTARPN
jgi:P27 family predicted phage terminase small subunit